MKRFQQSGFVMLLVIILGAVFMGVVIAIIYASTTNLRSSRLSYIGLNAQSVAEAGIDNGIFRLNSDNTYAGTNTSCPISGTGSNPVTLYNDNIKGKATYESCITDGTIANEKIIYATGKVYLPTNASKPTATRRLRVVLIGTFVPGSSYAVQTGPGGLIMSNSATISNGDVYVGGKITMINSATIGSAAKPVNVWAGNYVCPSPANASYPRLCTSGNPISISNTQAHIYGNVRANGQDNSSDMSNAGLVATSGVAESILPDYDRSVHKAAVTSTMTATSASCSNNETRTWPANVHITGGNVTLSNNCIVTMLGNVWIDGSLTLNNKTVVKVDNTVAATPTVMIDGLGGLVVGNQATVSSNSAQIGARFITFWANSSCSPDCSDLTGTGLANSQTVVTINLGNQGLGAGSTFYARWSEVSVGNSGSANQILGQTINLSNPGNIIFGGGTGLSSGGSYSYAMRFYEQI